MNARILFVWLMVYYNLLYSWFHGESGAARTPDLKLKRLLLCQLSYRPISLHFLMSVPIPRLFHITDVRAKFFFDDLIYQEVQCPFQSDIYNPVRNMLSHRPSTIHTMWILGSHASSRCSSMIHHPKGTEVPQLRKDHWS